MKYVKQFAILVAACFAGEILHLAIPLQIPAAIYGLVLMFCALQFKILPLSEVEEASDFLLEIMPLLFVPSTVGIVVAWPVIKANWLPLLLIAFAGTAFCFFVVGRTTQFFVKFLRRRKKEA